jgi:hypothetical protein
MLHFSCATRDFALLFFIALSFFIVCCILFRRLTEQRNAVALPAVETMLAQLCCTELQPLNILRANKKARLGNDKVTQDVSTLQIYIFFLN